MSLLETYVFFVVSAGVTTNLQGLNALCQEKDRFLLPQTSFSNDAIKSGQFQAHGPTQIQVSPLQRLNEPLQFHTLSYADCASFPYRTTPKMIIFITFFVSTFTGKDHILGKFIMVA